MTFNQARNRGKLNEGKEQNPKQRALLPTKIIKAAGALNLPPHPVIDAGDSPSLGEGTGGAVGHFDGAAQTPPKKKKLNGGEKNKSKAQAATVLIAQGGRSLVFHWGSEKNKNRAHTSTIC